MNVVLGFDTSCYTTSVAVVDSGGNVLGSFRRLLPVEKGSRGLRQSEGVFSHVRQIGHLVEEAFLQVKGMRVAAVGISQKPRDDDESYMPVFAVGDAHGRAIAAALGVPAFSFSHQRGHIWAARVESGLSDTRFLALHLSGGTTEMVLVENDTLTLLGGTKDLNAGQLIDRAGVALGFGFPSGPALEACALKGASEALLPTAMADGGVGCHLSGAETQVLRWIEEGKKKEDVALEIFDFLSRTVAKLILAGSRKAGDQSVLVAGGVASSALFRERLAARLKKLDSSITLYFGKPEFSGDNAVGIALLALAQLQKES